MRSVVMLINGYVTPAIRCDIELMMNCRRGRAWAQYLWRFLHRLNYLNII